MIQTQGSTSANFDTWLTRILGIRHPLLIGGMMWLGRAELVAAAVRAGASGFLSALTFSDPMQLRDEILKCRDLAGSDRFGVNLYISGQEERGAQLNPLIDVVCDLQVPFVETSGGRPDTLLGPLRDAGTKVLHKVPSVRHGRSAARLGVDAVILVGAAAAGHPGPAMVGSFVQAVIGAAEIPVPVILAGGIGHGSQLAAALAMGCEGVLIGTRVMAAIEAICHPNLKRRLIESDGTDTAIIQSVFNRHHRVLSNEATEKALGLEREGISDFERYRPFIGGDETWSAIRSGEFNRGAIDMGQSAGLVDRIESVEEVVERIIKEAVASAGRLSTLLVASPT